MKWIRYLAERRIRPIVRVTFLAMMLGVALLPLVALQWEKALSHKSYAGLLDERKQRLRAWAETSALQFALDNPSRLTGDLSPLPIALLPFDAIQFDDPLKVRDLLGAVGCPVHYDNGARFCAGAARSEEAELKRLYLAGTFRSAKLVAQAFKGGRPMSAIDSAHRLRIDLTIDGREYGWVLPVQVKIDATTGAPVEKPGLVAFKVNSKGDLPTSGDALRHADFRGGWITQGGCLPPDTNGDTCTRESSFSIQVKGDTLLDRLVADGHPSRLPPASTLRARVRLLAPGPAGATLLDTNGPGRLSISLNDLQALLGPDETATLSRRTSTGEYRSALTLTGKSGPSSGWMSGLISGLPLSNRAADMASDDVFTLDKSVRISYAGSFDGVNDSVAEGAAPFFFYAFLILVATGLAWLAIEVGIVRRVLRLTNKASEVSRAIHDETDLGQFSFAELRGRNELGTLATVVDDLLVKIAEAVTRQRAHIKHEDEVLRAIGHEIRSPLQGLLARANPEDAQSQRYIQRMMNALNTLYGTGAPAESLEQARMGEELLDVSKFLTVVAKNAHEVEINDVHFTALDSGPLMVRVDPGHLEDTITHLLTNAARCRTPGTPISIGLEVGAGEVAVSVHNAGPQIPTSMLDRIFEYGVTDQAPSEGTVNQGQGLFVARTYMLKMGGTIAARNVEDGVVFELRLPKAKS